MENDIYNYLQKIPGSTWSLVAELQRWISFEFWFWFNLKLRLWFSALFGRLKFSLPEIQSSIWYSKNRHRKSHKSPDSFVAKVIKARKSPSSIIATTIVNTKWINQVLADKPKLQLQWWWFFNDPHSLLPRDKWEKWFVLQLHYY